MRELSDAEMQLRIVAELDQLTTGLRDRNPEGIDRARYTLALLARDASPKLLEMIFRAIAAAGP